MRKQVLLVLMLAGLTSASFAQHVYNGATGADINGVVDGTGVDFNWEKDGNWVDKGNSNAAVALAPTVDGGLRIEIRGGSSYMSESQNVNLSTAVEINRLYIGHGNTNAGSLTIKSGGVLTANGGYLSVGGSAAGTLNIEHGGVYQTTDRVRISNEGVREGKNPGAGVLNCAGELKISKNLEFQTKAIEKGYEFSEIADLNILGTVPGQGGVVTVGQWADTDIQAGSGKITISDQGVLIYTSEKSINDLLLGLIDEDVIVPHEDNEGELEIVETSEEKTRMVIIEEVETEETYTEYTTTVRTTEYVLSVAPNATLNFSVYPNPASSVVTVSSEAAISSIALFNSLGQQVLSADGASADVSGLATGVYVLKAIDANGNVGVQRVIVE